MSTLSPNKWMIIVIGSRAAFMLPAVAVAADDDDDNVNDFIRGIV